ncbi:hypothetical protein MTAT_19820 [Moorella thermoacetica]|uniref:ATPase dynein-related AAA domain-containing protein n=1 Tax=Neomoorella thermoacetica TaxID=1525 RepID=A0AAC9HIL9_NEOTH|nr:hypothetical protein [Moorella thermoacetica]AOQ24637.1 hypothetical protein Maut_02209 [Moorella thermoacetica]TYL12740.1 hypothetical protein MTAT_19820 [Moorella thermoacetica]
MLIKEAKTIIKELLTNTNIVPALVGERGIGKSEALKQAADELGIGYFDLYASALEGPDFMGLIDKDRQAGVTRYLPPEFLPTEQAVAAGMFPEKGIFVLEELNRAETQTVHTLYPLLLYGRINQHHLASGWKLAVAMNPDTAAYTTNALDDAALDRMMILDVEPTVDEYSSYCLQTDNYNMDVLEFLQENKEMLLQKNGNGMDKAPCPRAWSRVQEIRNKCNLSDELMFKAMAGLVGSRAAASLAGYLRNRELKPPRAEEVFKDYNEVRPRLLEILKKNRYDIVALLSKQIAREMNLGKNHLNAVEKYVFDLPDELQVMFMRQLHEMRPNDFLKIMTKLPSFKEKLASRLVEAWQAA